MPELVEVLVFLKIFLYHSIIGSFLKKVVHPPRTKLDGTPFQNERIDLSSIFQPEESWKLIAAEVRGNSFAISFGHMETVKTIVYSFGLGACLDWIDASKIEDPNFLLQPRINHYFQFVGKDAYFTLVDATTSPNMPEWKVYDKLIGNLTEEDWGGPPDPINNWNSYRIWVSTKFLHKKFSKNKKPQNWSVAKALHSHLFNGVGVYLSSEVLFWLDKIYKIKPWDRLGMITNGNSTLMKMIAILKVLVSDILFYEKYHDITKHNGPAIKNFYLHFLQAYRKTDTTCWEFNGYYKLGKIHTKLKESPPQDIMKSESWKKIESTPLAEEMLGVGPIWWHQEIDFWNVEYIESNKRTIEEQEVTPSKKQKTVDQTIQINTETKTTETKTTETKTTETKTTETKKPKRKRKNGATRKRDSFKRRVTEELLTLHM